MGRDQKESEGQRELSRETAFEQSFWLRECTFAAHGIEVCPRNHGEAMMLPHAQKCDRRRLVSLILTL